MPTSRKDQSKIDKQSGVTMIELLLYIGIASVILGITVLFLFTITGSRAKSQTIAEVEGQGTQAVNLISYTLRNAERVNQPAPASSGQTLSVNVTDPTKDPTVFTISGGKLVMTEGASDPIDITTDRLEITSLTFTNLARPETKDLIRISLTLSHKNPNNQNQFAFTKDFHTSISTR